MKLFKQDAKKKWLKSLPSRVSSAAMILENDVGQILIVKANYKPHWTLPGGVVDPGETPKEAAIRETFEEVGVRLDPRKVAFVAVINRKSDIADTYQFLFKAVLRKGALREIVLQASEIDEYALVTRTQVATKDRYYGKVIEHWAAGRTGYLEQTFGRGDA